MIETGVYCWRNKVNGKVYVGAVYKTTFAKRKSGHLTSLRRGREVACKQFRDDWKEYGEENFEWVILERCEPHDVEDAEEYWIGELNATDPKCGYNYYGRSHIRYN
jgi:group I intron endonuclease